MSITVHIIVMRPSMAPLLNLFFILRTNQALIWFSYAVFDAQLFILQPGRHGTRCIISGGGGGGCSPIRSANFDFFGKAHPIIIPKLLPEFQDPFSIV
jgi:hypothetical protein